jgi:CheY-like chemotaxis protein
MARILLVEDDPALSRGIIALLKGAGHAADCAKDGETALFLAESEPCGLIILDIGLPRMSGFEVICKLRARGCKTPILVLTAPYNGAMVVHLTEIVPVAVRTAGFSLAYSLATTIGGSTPVIVTYLIHETGNRAMPGAWLSVAAAIAFVSAWIAVRRDQGEENILPETG